MSYGDSTTRKASVNVNGIKTMTINYGLPVEGGASGTCLTDFANDAYGRVCNDGSQPVQTTAIRIDLGELMEITSIVYTVLEVYPYLPPLGIPKYGGRAGFKGYENTVAYPLTDTFYGQGTWDVGLQQLRMLDQSLQLVPQTFLQTAMANDNRGSNPYYDKAINCMRTPYLLQTCTNMYNFLSDCSGENSATYILNSSSYPLEQNDICPTYFGKSAPCHLWPCTSSIVNDNFNRGDCSNSPVPLSWGFLGFRVRDGHDGNTFSLKPMVSPSMFMRITPKPSILLNLPQPTTITEVRLRTRNMAWGDATISRVLVIVDDIIYVANFGPPTLDCSSGTCLTDLSKDAYGRNGVAASINVQVDITSASVVKFVIDEVHGYNPPVELLDGIHLDNSFWKVSKLQSEHNMWYHYAHSTNGTLNVGFTEITLLNNGVEIPFAQLGDLSNTVSGSGTYSSMTVDIPFRYSYVTEAERFTSGTGSTDILKSHCWYGKSVIDGEATGHQLSDSAPNPVQPTTPVPEPQ
jgi:hypothetical protein